jgi:hypothetical protein
MYNTKDIKYSNKSNIYAHLEATPGIFLQKFHLLPLSNIMARGGGGSAGQGEGAPPGGGGGGGPGPGPLDLRRTARIGLGLFESGPFDLG